MNNAKRSGDETQLLDLSLKEFENAKAVISSAKNANESTTRLRAIDTMLFDVLGWEKGNAECEKYSRGEGFADYVLGSTGSSMLVVEAKRDSIQFVLSRREYPNKPVSYRLVAAESANAASAFQQALGYASTLGARYVAVTNGWQWIIGLTFVSGQEMADRSLLVFESLEAVEKRFEAFWFALGPAGVRSNRLAGLLVEARLAPAPKKASSAIPNYPVPASRNKIANELSTVIDLVWTGIKRAEASEKFLKECYVRPRGDQGGMSLAKELIADRLQVDGARVDAGVPTSKALEIVKEGVGERPILVIGKVGHGKTTFLRYLRSVEAQESLKGYIQIEIDFLDKPDNAENVASFVYGELDRQLLNNYKVDVSDDGFVRGALNSKLARFKKTPVAKMHDDSSLEYKQAEVEHIESIRRNHHEYLGDALRHLRRGRGKSICIFMDNLDRRTDDIQEEAFLRSSAIARDWECLVFLCLRPGTYHRSRQRGVLDSVAPRVITVSSPNPSVLLKKRFSFAAQLARGQIEGIGESIGKGSRGVAFDLPTVAEFLDCCQDSFWHSKNLVGLFEAAANGSTRRILELVSDVLSSNHLNTGKILKLMGRGYRVPVHEAINALVYGDFLQYSPEGSPFINLFDIAHSDPREHFVCILILSIVQRMQKGSGSLGFVAKDSVDVYLSQIGFSVLVSGNAIERLYSAGLLDGPIGHEDWSLQVLEIRLTTLGKYHLNHLVGTFQYVDAMVLDTPILDEELRQGIDTDRRIEVRLSRVELFVQYLAECSQALEDGDSQSVWNEIQELVTGDIESVRKSLQGRSS